MHLTQGRGVHVEEDKKIPTMSYLIAEGGTENAVSC